MAKWSTGCGLHGIVLSPFFFNRSIQYSRLFKIKLFFCLFQVFVCLFVCLFCCFCIGEQWRRSGGLCQVWMIGGGSPRHLNNFSNFLLLYCCCTLHTYQYMLCIVAIVDCTHVYHVVVQYTTYHILLLLTASI